MRLAVLALFLVGCSGVPMSDPATWSGLEERARLTWWEDTGTPVRGGVVILYDFRMNEYGIEAGWRSVDCSITVWPRVLAAGDGPDFDTRLVSVLLHEFGHAQGLPHLAAGLMAPTSDGRYPVRVDAPTLKALDQIVQPGDCL